MTEANKNNQIQTAFVTGATGLLGNNLVRLLIARGVRVKALARSREKAAKQFENLPVEIVLGDIANIAGFAEHLRGVDVLFHTAAFFRDSFKGGRHWKELHDTNVRGTKELLEHAYVAGIPRVVHTSSIAVLRGAPGLLTDETMLRTAGDADDYYLSKILSDRALDAFLEKHPDMSASLVLPGWMVGPGDIGPTSSGQVILDFVSRKLPGIPPASFSLVDARDVAEAMWLAATNGRRGERYLAAGRHMPMSELFQILERITGIPAPRRKVPVPMLLLLGAFGELWARLTGKPALISLATARLMVNERDRSHFDNAKSERELGLKFRPAEETLRDAVAWYQENGWLANTALRTPPVRQTKVASAGR
jgi:dihydroflavonol-4-reductase